MSTRWPGGIISQTAPVPSGPYQNSTAPGVWTLEQQAYWARLGQWPTAGNTDPSAFIENLFSTYLYTGNGSTQTITNGIDLAGKGGMVWIKGRNNTQPNALQDTSRGAGFILYSNDTSGQDNYAGFTGYIDQFNANGFQIKSGSANWNVTNNTYASWTFRKQPKFFDVVTYTGNGTARTIAHNLGSTPGMIIVKRTDTTANWRVYHRSTGKQSSLFLNLTNAASTGDTDIWNDTDPTSTVFSVGTNAGVNASGGTYVAYLFAHNAGGFGLTGTDNVISCGSVTGTGVSPGPRVELGWEPQFILYKRATVGTGDWNIHDSMRGLGVGTSSTSGSGNRLEPNTSDAETGSSNFANIDATGFTITATVADINANGSTYIYMAIRRGPMAVPTLGTSVFAPFLQNGTVSSGGLAYNFGFPPDAVLEGVRGGAGFSPTSTSRLTGNFQYMVTSDIAAEASDGGYRTYTESMQGMTYGIGVNFASFGGIVGWGFKRAPGFFDEVCYTGDGTASRVISHNLTVSPELIISKARTGSNDWRVASSAIGFGTLDALALNSNAAKSITARPVESVSSTTLTLALIGANISTTTYVTYLFATVAGVSKVGSYTGTGTTQIVNCGFTGGARFVLIKRTDSTGDWYVWDSARGIVAGNDPYLLLNSTAAEITNTDYVDTASSGFEISSTAPAAINANGGTFIFLAIA